MRKTYLIVLLLIVSLRGIAQETLPPVYEIKSDTAEYQQLGSIYWQLLEDPTGKLTMSQVSGPASGGKFAGDYDAKKRVDYSKHCFWIRYRLKNMMPEKANICLVNSNYADYCDFYVSDSLHHLAHYITGNLALRDKMSGLKKAQSIPVALAPGEELLVYNRLQSSYYFNKPVSLEVGIGNTYQTIRENYVNGELSYSFHDFSLFFIGILAFGFILNLMFYLIERKKVYIYFSLFVAYFSFYAIDQLIVLNNPLIMAIISVIVNCFGIFLFVQFSRHFFHTSSRFPAWDKALVAIAYIHLAASMAAFLVEPHLSYKATDISITIKQLLFLVGLLMIMITYLKFVNDNNRLTRMLLIAAIPASVNWFVGFGLLYTFRFLNHFLHVARPPLANWLYNWFDTINVICVMWFVLAFSWVLLLQFIDLKKQNAQQALDNERLSKEKEMERAQLIEKQNAELEIQVAQRTADLKHSLNELKQTQNQLIQSEKMASLGELTAGIAHEIQNPLNFVNNFSEVNAELIDELQIELERGALDEVKAIAIDLQENEKKINLHGKRADGIVKGMLEHSRTNTGQKQPTDMNALCDEFLKLSYHGLRAKDKSFNAEMITHFGPKLPKVNVSQQDMGRVMLNLFNNAFYAVNQKLKTAGKDYKPEVTVTTFTPPLASGGLGVSVKDNGVGIPDAIKDKIMQPFFTTKPTGEGTGLGLSLTYDMVVKGHGGSIRVDSIEGEGSEFIISLPLG